MNACQTRDFGAEGVWDAPLLPCEKSLMGKRKLGAQDLGERFNQVVVVMRGIGHAPSYQRSVYVASPKSLIANHVLLAQKARMVLGERIKAAVQALKISQAEAARRCGWSAQRFGQYVTGARTPDLESLLRMAEVLNTTPDALLGVSEQPSTEIADILGKLLELEGLDPLAARTIAEAATAAQQVLKSLPGEADQEQARLAALAVWSARRIQATGTTSDQ